MWLRQAFEGAQTSSFGCFAAGRLRKGIAIRGGALLWMTVNVVDNYHHHDVSDGGFSANSFGLKHKNNKTVNNSCCPDE